MQEVRCHFFTLNPNCLQDYQFRFYFTSHLLTFHLSLTLLSTIARYVILSLGGWYPLIHTRLTSSYYLLTFLLSSHTGLSPSMGLEVFYTILMSTYSKVLCLSVKILAILVSLTITPRVSFDFLSYWYCNVLLPNVLYCSVYLRIV